MALRGSPKAVFIVEDDESMREAIAHLLCVAGFRTVVYGSRRSPTQRSGGRKPRVRHQRLEPSCHVGTRSYR
jgi:DNA-binding NtrC family response regulator